MNCNGNSNQLPFLIDNTLEQLGLSITHYIYIYIYMCVYNVYIVMVIIKNNTLVQHYPFSLYILFINKYLIILYLI